LILMLALSVAPAAWAQHAGHDAPPAAPSGERKILFYRNPMGLPDTSPVPKKDSMGMDYIPVYADEMQPAPQKERKILYYRNPMGLPDTSPVPKKDSMGMDYTPVYEDEVSAGATVSLSADKVQKLGVRTEPVQRRAVTRPIRAVGTIQVDERTVYVVAPKFEAWIEKLAVDTTGSVVKKGQPLMEVYSPELNLAQQEYLVARKSGGGAMSQQLADGALQKLRNLDVPDEEIERLRKTGAAGRTLTLRAAAGGVVLEKSALRGMRFMPGEALYRIADLSKVWLIADVFEQDMGLVRPGQEAEVVVNSLPGRVFHSTVDFIYPTLVAESRTGRVRIILDNAEGLLRPNLYATVQFTPQAGAPRLTVPDSALLDTGNRQVVLVEVGQGRFQPRQVKAGARGDGFVEVLEGLADGDRVVVRANFLIDSESNLRAALGAFGEGK
jgi:Cu(I)/Ag(I) efflux system membrane fusion protein